MSDQKQEYKEIIVLCNTCQGKKNHNLLFEIRENISTSNDGDGEGYMSECYSSDISHRLVQCKGCSSIFYTRTKESYTLDIASGDDYIDIISEEIYPNFPTNSIEKVPYHLMSVFKETVTAYNYNQFILCAGGLRAIIEGIYADIKDKPKPVEFTSTISESKKRNDLPAKIERLRDWGYITEPNKKMLDDLKVIGNKALHGLESPSKDKLEIAIKIIKQTLENIYVLPSHGERLGQL